MAGTRNDTTMSGSTSASCDVVTSCDVLVVGGGHAGIEAAMAASRLGCRVILMTMDPEKIGQMSCNPAIGGTAKGHVVREIDALGGVMAKLIDETGIQFKMLNRSKGPAMWSPRAQADRARYRAAAKAMIEADPRITIVQDIAARCVVEGGGLVGLVGVSGREYACRTAIISSGTFLNGLMHVGLRTEVGGRVDEPAATHLSESLRALGLSLGRLKTGTPPRVDGRTLDYSAMKLQPGDEPPPFFSFTAPRRTFEQVACWLTSTTERTHEIIRGGLDRSPLFTGRIKGIGPRYCPSIEDKVVRFPERDHHQIFIEPEGLNTSEVYVNGFASSLPEEVQLAALRAVRGMEEAVMNRPGYAVEYDFVFPHQLYPSLETKLVRRLYLAGQINGTSGYEEAAGQGLMAGINAARSVMGLPPVILGRHEAYISVMIDDLVTKGTEDPYRLFTSRAEHRLLLRQDNADTRLADRALEAGMIDEAEHRRRKDKVRRVQVFVEALERTRIGPEEANPVLAARGTAPIGAPQSAVHLLRRPEITLADLDAMAALGDDLSPEERWQAEVAVKYEGYLARQEEAAERQQALERRQIPADMEYAKVVALSAEAKQKLANVRPTTLGQAARVPGITPADIAVLAIALEQRRRSGAAAEHVVAT